MLYVSYAPKFLQVPINGGENFIEKEIIKTFLEFYPFAEASDEVDYQEFINCASQLYHFIMSQYSDYNNVTFLNYNPMTTFKEQHWFKEIKSKNSLDNNDSLLLIGNGDNGLFYRNFHYFSFVKVSNPYLSIDQYWDDDFYKENNITKPVIASLSSEGEDEYYRGKSIYSVLKAFYLQGEYNLKLKNLFNGKIYILDLNSISNVNDINSDFMFSNGFSDEFNQFDDYDEVYLIEKNIEFIEVFDILFIDGKPVICNYPLNVNYEEVLSYSLSLFEKIYDYYYEKRWFDVFNFYLKLGLSADGELSVISADRLYDLTRVKEHQKMRESIDELLIHGIKLDSLS
jgi:hypothetical protein